MKKILIIILTFTIISCKNQSEDTISATSKPKETLKIETKENDPQLNSNNKIGIDFEKNKDLLDIILLLPDNAFQSWEWKLEDRIKWYNEIKTNNYYTDDNPDFFNQKYLEPDKAGFTIVDGSWTINLYKALDNSYIVITDDIVGDGNSLNIYEVKSNELKEFQNEKSLFSNYTQLLKKKETDNNCTEKYEELNDPIFNYDFTNKNEIVIESSWYLTKESYDDCLTGNAILYNFNPQTKKFELNKIYWKAKQSN
ncbi:hypothetical protein [Flavobacterium sp.]|uniref:hypothetical protein n=1 Tax=Flavobacterium sp. TaxID=239 RepID=UPI00404735C0